MLRRAVLRYVMLRYTMLRYAILHHAMLHPATQHHATLHHATLPRHVHLNCLTNLAFLTAKPISYLMTLRRYISYVLHRNL